MKTKSEKTNWTGRNLVGITMENEKKYPRDFGAKGCLLHAFGFLVSICAEG